jgi:TPR repeat protein
MRLIPVLLLLCISTVVQAEAEPERTIRICDDTGCSDRPRSTTTFNPNADVNPDAERRLAALKAKAEQDPRAAYDLGLRYFRGDGVRQDSYQALQWMRDAAERGDRKAQTAVGKLYLMGLEEMGSDPAEAEKWLSIAAGRGDKEAKKLLGQASAAKKNEVAYRRWVDTQRVYLREYWQSRYTYRWYWNNNGWYYRDNY